LGTKQTDKAELADYPGSVSVATLFLVEQAGPLD